MKIIVKNDAFKEKKSGIVASIADGVWTTKKEPIKFKNSNMNINMTFLADGLFLDFRHWLCGQQTSKNKPYEKGMSFHRGILAPTVDVIVEMQRRRSTLSYSTSGVSSTEAGTDSALDLRTLGCTSSSSTVFSSHGETGEAEEFLNLVKVFMEPEQDESSGTTGLDLLAEAACIRKAYDIKNPDACPIPVDHVSGCEDLVILDSDTWKKFYMKRKAPDAWGRLMYRKVWKKTVKATLPKKQKPLRFNRLLVALTANYCTQDLHFFIQYTYHLDASMF